MKIIAKATPNGGTEYRNRETGDRATVNPILPNGSGAFWLTCGEHPLGVFTRKSAIEMLERRWA